MKRVLNVFVAVVMTTALMGAIYRDDWFKTQSARGTGM